ncbi:MAG: DUF4254 domain-containing protein [Gammaproteobacteria bacterium]
MFEDVKPTAISEFHDACVTTDRWAKTAPARFNDGLWHYIELNHRNNCLLWDEEDQARRLDVGDELIAANKRAIDGYNQRRQDAIEKIDECLLQRAAGVARLPDARQNSETAGSIIDRLSILSLKLYHMDKQRQRTDAGVEHVERCAAKHRVLQEQRADLQNCLQVLLRDVARGAAYFKVYRQFKMYNDPSLNPYLYGDKR